MKSLQRSHQSTKLFIIFFVKETCTVSGIDTIVSEIVEYYENKIIDHIDSPDGPFVNSFVNETCTVGDIDTLVSEISYVIIPA